jgi:hypothetical protein
MPSEPATIEPQTASSAPIARSSKAIWSQVRRRRPAPSGLTRERPGRRPAMEMPVLAIKAMITGADGHSLDPGQRNELRKGLATCLSLILINVAGGAAIYPGGSAG